ncbi:MAG: L-ribulose-5-phosphate 3-epimerase [Defluviitaleaceae bacterium]|nr:L-ribulose-5-phosphate 3-epimerase [Defluviitaleaceae bacterium]
MREKFQKKYRLGLYEKAAPNSLSLREKLHEAGEAGFDFLELSVDETDEKLSRLDWSKAERLGLVAAGFDTGIKVETICLSAHRRFPLGCEDKAKRERSIGIMRGAIGLASDIGARLIQIAGYDEYYGESNERTRLLFYKGLRECVAHAASRGVVLAFETMETEFINTVEKAMHYVNLINSPYLKVYPDIGNVTNAAKQNGALNATAAYDLVKGFGHIAALHLKESLPGVYREVPFGSGHVNFEEAAAEALKQGVGLFVGEFWHKGEKNWRELLSEANVFLRDKIENCGYKFESSSAETG